MGLVYSSGCKTGMRFSEALAITPGDFDFARQTLSINKTWDYKGDGGFLPTKNKSSVRKIQIDWQVVVKFAELTKEIPEGKPIFVGGSKIYNSTVNGVLTRHCKKSGISEISMHGLRHPYVKPTTKKFLSFFKFEMAISLRAFLCFALLLGIKEGPQLVPFIR